MTKAPYDALWAPYVSILLRAATGTLGGMYILERECDRHVGIFFAADLDIRINEVVQSGPGLRRLEAQVAADGELHAIGVALAKVVVVQVTMFPGFGDVDGHPSLGIEIEVRPAVIAGDFA